MATKNKAKAKAKAINLTPFRDYGLRMMTENDAAGDVVTVRVADLIRMVKDAAPKATGRDDAKLAPVFEAIRSGAAIAWCGRPRETADGVAHPVDKVLSGLALDKKGVKALPDNVKEGIKAARGAARKALHDDLKRAFPEWFVKAEAEGEAEGGAEAEGEADEEAKGAMDAATLRANFRVTMSTLPSDEALALAKAIIEDAQGFSRAIRAGAKIERTLKAA
jgi:hypothetical protein